MAVIARLKSIGGGPTIPTLTAAATLDLGQASNVFLLSGTATVTLLGTDSRQPGRIVAFIGSSGTTTFTNSNGTSTNGQMDLGGQNRAISAEDVLVLVQKGDGSWRLVAHNTATPASALTALTSAASLSLTDGIDRYKISGTETVTAISVTAITPGRTVTILGWSGVTTFTNTSGSTTSGQMDLRGSNRAVGIGQVIVLIQDDNGVWQLVSAT